MPKQTQINESSAHLDLANKLPVVESSTTSRVLVTNPLMRIVQFTFDAGELLTTHTSPRAVSCLLSEGRMSWTVGDAEYDMRAGDVIYLAPGTPHSLTAVEPSRLTLTMVDLEGAVGEA